LSSNPPADPDREVYGQPAPVYGQRAVYVQSRFRLEKQLMIWIPLIAFVGLVLFGLFRHAYHKKPPGEARDSVLQVRLTAVERELLDRAAQAKSLDTSAWVRSEVLALARQLLRAEPGAQNGRPPSQPSG
jgi:hypothetical protein